MHVTFHTTSQLFVFIFYHLVWLFPPDSAIRPGCTINVETGDVVDGVSHGDWKRILNNNIIRDVYAGPEIENVLSGIFANDIDNSMFLNDKDEAITPFLHLNGCTWFRAKGAGEVTREHVDYFYFYNNSNVISDHHWRPRVDEVDPKFTSPIPDNNTITCAMCQRHFIKYKLQPSVPARRPKQWHCHGCINLPSACFTVWIPLTEIGEGDSRLAIIPGSHKLSGYERNRGELPGDYTPAMESSSQWEVPANMQQGDIIIFDWKTIHAATSNNSGKYRLSIDTRITTGKKQQLTMSSFENRKSHRNKSKSCAPLDPSLLPPTSNNPDLTDARAISKIRPGSKRMVLMSDDAQGLAFNCAQMSTNVRTSTIPNAGRGLFTSTDHVSKYGKMLTQPEFGSKDYNHKYDAYDRRKNRTRVISYMFGIIRPKSRLVHIIKNPSDARGAEIDYVSDHLKGINMEYNMEDWLSSNEDAYAMVISRQCPMGIMNDPNKREPGYIHTMPRLVATIQWIYSDAIDQKNDKWSWKTFAVTIPDVDVPAGTEIFFEYHWNRMDWKKVKHKMSSNETGDAKCRVFDRQKQNVQSFMQLSSSQSVMNDFRYSARSGEITKSEIHDLSHVALQESIDIPGCMGVILVKKFKSEM